MNLSSFTASQDLEPNEGEAMSLDCSIESKLVGDGSTASEMETKKATVFCWVDLTQP